MNDVRPERTGFRGEALSRRHRRWGFNCPCVDIDFLLIEYNFGLPAALVDYKAVSDMSVSRQVALDATSGRSIRAMATLASNSKIPFFFALYRPDPWMFRTLPGNDYCDEWMGGDDGWMSEYDYVRLLYQIRRTRCTEQIVKTLADCSRELPGDGVQSHVNVRRT